MADDFTSPREIAELNIRHYRQLLEAPLDDQTRTIVERLLAQEIAALANLTQPGDRVSPKPRTDEPADGNDP